LSIGELGLWQWLALFQHELLLFAGIFFLIGAADDLAVDALWLWLRLTGRAAPPVRNRMALVNRPLHGPAAVLIPAWEEAAVIGDTIAHLLASWPQATLRLYVGCYRNDPATLAAAAAAASTDPRVRLVIHDRDGPSTKADCLNRLYTALATDEARSGQRFAMVVFHDAEDMVDPAAHRGRGRFRAAAGRTAGAAPRQLAGEPPRQPLLRGIRRSCLNCKGGEATSSQRDWVREFLIRQTARRTAFSLISVVAFVSFVVISIPSTRGSSVSRRGDVTWPPWL